MRQFMGLPVDQIPQIFMNLLLNPGYVSRYLTQSVLNRKSRRTPVDLELPWFPFAVIDFLHTYLTPDMKVCEYGCGGSTLFFAQRVKTVYSIEHNLRWFELVSHRLKERSISNVRLNLFPLDPENLTSSQTSDYVRAIPADKLDVIVVDGTEGPSRQMRPTCFKYAEGRIKPGGIIIIDDSWRYTALRTTHQARRFKVFQSVKPCNLEVSSTDIYFYGC